MKVRLVFKVGDQFPGTYYKQNMGMRDGMLVDYYAEGLYWPELSDHMKKVYAITEMDVAEAEWPAVQAALAAAVDQKQVWVSPGKPDLVNWRARSKLVTLSQLAVAAGDSKLETQWRDSTVVAPKPLTWATVAGLLKDSTTLNPPASDLHVVTAGTYTVGSAVGDSYASWAAAAADTANQTGNLTFQQNSDLSAAAVASWSHNLAGFTFTITNNVWHSGCFGRGYATLIAVNSDMFQFGMEGPGTVDFNRLRIRRTTAGSVAGRYCLQIVNVDAAWTGYIHHNMLNGNSLLGGGLHVNDNTPTLYIYCNRIRQWTGAACIGLNVAAGNAANVYENNTVHGNNGGINAGNQGGTYRRNAAYADTTDYANTANATGHSNASDDATAANANWAGGSANNISARDPAVDFDSQVEASPMFLRPVNGGGLQNPVNVTYLVANTTDLAGRAWATYDDWIGCRVGLPVPTLPAGNAYRVNGSTVAVPVRKVFEGMHTDDTNVPVIITEGSADFGGAGSLWWTTATAANIVASSTLGVAYPTVVMFFDAINRRMTVAVKVPTMDADTDIDLILQCGGTGPTSTAVFQACYAANVNYNVVWGFKEAAGNITDYSGNAYTGVAAGVGYSSPGVIGPCLDFESGDTSDQISNAAAGNLEFNQAFTALLWIKRESVGASMSLIGRYDNTLNANRGWEFLMSGANLPAFTLANDTNPAVYAQITAPANASLLWQQMVCRNAGTGLAAGMDVFTNAQQQTRTVALDALGGNTIITAQAYKVGNVNVTNLWYDGLADFPRVVLAALTQAQIGTHYSDEVDAANNGAYLLGDAITIPVTPSPSPSPTPTRRAYFITQTKIANTVGVGVGF